MGDDAREAVEAAGGAGLVAEAIAAIAEALDTADGRVEVAEAFATAGGGGLVAEALAAAGGWNPWPHRTHRSRLQWWIGSTGAIGSPISWSGSAEIHAIWVRTSMASCVAFGGPPPRGAAGFDWAAPVPRKRRAHHTVSARGTDGSGCSPLTSLGLLSGRWSAGCDGVHDAGPVDQSLALAADARGSWACKSIEVLDGALPTSSLSERRSA
jgi:hypothetical protein